MHGAWQVAQPGMVPCGCSEHMARVAAEALLGVAAQKTRATGDVGGRMAVMRMALCQECWKLFRSEEPGAQLCSACRQQRKLTVWVEGEDRSEDRPRRAAGLAQ